MRIIFSRHGLTDYNIKNRICGVSSAMLTNTGKQQAIELGLKLKNENIDVIISSPLQRAIDTARLANESIGAEIIIDERFTEWNYGSYEGAVFDDVYCDFQRAKCEFGVRLGGGESVLQLAHRVFGAIDDIREKYKEKTVLVVCHGGICRVAKMYFEDMTMKEFAEFFMGNGQVNEYTI